MKRIFTLLLLGLLAGEANAACPLPKPGNVEIKTIVSCNATMTWNSVPGTSFYKVKYKKTTGGSGWNLISTQITGTSYTFTGLNPNTSYTFAVAACCNDINNSGFKQVKKTTTNCAYPANVASSVIGTTANITWTPQCGVIVYNLRYKLSTDLVWSKIPNISTSNYLLSGLTALTSYDVALQGSCGTDTSKWSSKITFTTATPTVVVKPNILLIMLDDGRYDNYQPNGGPSFFNSPAINRIAYEGVNFKYAFPTTSQCAPSRVSIYTGLYAHKHGAIDNDTRMDDGLTLIQQILKDNGYYTGFVGKYGQLQGDPTGFDWWATSEGNVYVDAIYSINDGPDTMIQGHIANVYEDLAMYFLSSVPAQKRFMLMYFTRIPHGPTIPRTEDLGLYTTETMPFPDNVFKYPSNYPSYFYSTHNWGYTPEESDSMRLAEFQVLAGLEDNVNTFISYLEGKGILDSTLIIFTSDNGFLKGEHKLEAKQIAQEESIRVPMFIRFPSWFPPNTVVTNKMAANIDIPVTLLDAAGIPDTFGMDGLSLKKLYDQTVERKYFFYQYAGESGAPTIRAIRSQQYKYVKHFCTSVTEEFYDLVNDPKENTNLINNSSFASLISSYRTKLDSIRTAENDDTPVNIPCNLNNPQYSREEDENEDVNDRILRLWPNPAADYFLVNFNEAGNSEDIVIEINNPIGQLMYYKEIPNTDILSSWVPCSSWMPGVYLVTLRKGGTAYTGKIVIQN